VKENANGSINKYNWLPMDSIKCKGLISETFSLLVKPVTIRIVFTLAITNQWDLGQLDVNNVFLNDLRNGTVHKSQPPRFQRFNTSLVCKVNKAFYGLKQAPDNGLKDCNLLFFSLVLWQKSVIPLFSCTKLVLTLLIS